MYPTNLLIFYANTLKNKVLVSKYLHGNFLLGLGLRITRQLLRHAMWPEHPEKGLPFF
jgi:hypothetical protein